MDYDLSIDWIDDVFMDFDEASNDWIDDVFTDFDEEISRNVYFGAKIN